MQSPRATGSRFARSPQAQGALKELAKLLPDKRQFALLVNALEEVGITDLRDGDLLALSSPPVQVSRPMVWCEMVRAK